MEPLVEYNKEVGRFSAFLSSIGVEENKSKIMLFAVLMAVLFFATLSFLLMPPFDSPGNTTITIERGARLSEVSKLLYQENLIRSRALFEVCAKLTGGKKPVIAGTYLFKEPASACTIATRIASGASGVPAVRVTIPEGMSNQEMATVLTKAFPGFNKSAFLEQQSLNEGFLFPDTYFFSKATPVETIGKTLRANFDKKIESLQKEISTSGHTLREVIIMASILEKEAMTDEDKALVSGVLWKRIEKGMPLQVDATFMYLLGKPSSEITTEDLKMKSGYNTYQNRGLPVGPIGNPGLAAIRAAIHPTASPFLYYLSDNDGVMHYAKTFEEHKANKFEYLK